MKEDLISIVNDIPNIESKFRAEGSEFGYFGSFIYDNPDFIKWLESVKYELQGIYDRTNDKYIWEIINATGIIHKFDGKHHDEKKRFESLKSSLQLILKNADKYYSTIEIEKGEKTMKKPMIFISHASADIKYVQPLVDLLADIGLDNTNLFCSSVPDYGIPLGKDIYDYLASLFNEYELHVIFMLSDNYYESKPCLNEMGAAWVLKNDYTSILLPKFKYSDIEGAVNPNVIGLKYDDNEELLKLRLGQLKEIIVKKIGKTVPDMRWEKKRNEFIETINSLISKGD